jgi:hypothetical protein
MLAKYRPTAPHAVVASGVGEALGSWAGAVDGSVEVAVGGGSVLVAEVGGCGEDSATGTAAGEGGAATGAEVLRKMTAEPIISPNPTIAEKTLELPLIFGISTCSALNPPPNRPAKRATQPVIPNNSAKLILNMALSHYSKVT